MGGGERHWQRGGDGGGESLLLYFNALLPRVADNWAQDISAPNKSQIDRTEANAVAQELIDTIPSIHLVPIGRC